MKRFHYFIILCVAILATGCSCSSESSSGPTDISKISPEISAAAIAAADSVIELRNNETLLNEKLLDVRATIHPMSTNQGNRAAEDFEYVFRTHIEADCDSLAAILF